MELRKQSYSEVLVIPGSWLRDHSSGWKWHEGKEHRVKAKEELRGEGIAVPVARSELVRVEGDGASRSGPE